jgi:septum formation protein
MAEMATRDLLLASASVFRRKLLEAAGVAFRVVPAQVDEAEIKAHLASEVEPAALAEALAAAKAEAVSARFPGAMVIGADQVLALGAVIIDKPRDLAEARAQLEHLRGKTHRLFTAAALAEDGRTVWKVGDSATLTMRHFTGEFIDGYLAQSRDAVCQMAGSYDIEGRGIQFFERVEGDHFTIIGLPLLPLLAELRARGVLPT